MKTKSHVSDLSRCRYGEIREIKYDLAVLPWGATEPHNYHLPYSTDTLLAYCLAMDAACEMWKEQGLRIMVLPAVPFGSQNPGQWNKPFCIHTRYETQRALLGDIVASLQRQGFARLVILNSHGGNSFRNMVRDLAFECPDFMIAVADSFAIVPTEDFFEQKDDHAGEMETSLLLHYHPELVTMEEAGAGTSQPFVVESLNRHTAWVPRHWDRISDDTGIGNPRAASAEKGKRYAQAVVGRLAQLFAELASASDIYR